MCLSHAGKAWSPFICMVRGAAGGVSLPACSADNVIKQIPHILRHDDGGISLKNVFISKS